MKKLKYKHIRHFRVKTPLILQMEETECGAAALAIILAYYKKYVPLSELREACDVSRDGSRAINIMRAAQSYQLSTQAFSVDHWETIFDMTLPCIVFWEFKHFIVVEGFRHDKIYINDPAMGPTTLSVEQFSKGFTGVVFIFKPTAAFQSSGKPPSLLKTISMFLKYEKSTLSYILLASLLLMIPGIVIPGFAKIFVDNILMDKMHEWLMPLLLGMLMTIVLRTVCTGLEQYYLLRLKIKLFYNGSKKFLSTLFKLPLQFFMTRYSGDLAYRMDAYENIAQTLSSDISSSIVSIISMIFYAIVMLLISWPLALIGIIVAIINTCLMIYMMKKISIHSYQLVQAQGKLKSIELTGLQIIETIKLSSAGSYFFQHWSGLHARTVNKKQIISLYNMVLQIVPQLFSFLTTIAFLSIGIYLVSQGRMTLGTIVAMQSLVMSFNLPLMTLLSLSGELSTIQGDFLRIADIIEYAKNKKLLTPVQAIKPASDFSDKTFSVENLTFGYSKFEPPIISQFSLRLKNKQSIAIVGPTGCGKSTIAKLIMGLYTPWSGRLQYNNICLSEYSKEDLSHLIAITDNDSFLFSGSVRDNLTLWNSKISDETLEQALRIACMTDELVSRGGLNAEIKERGINFSGGQRQRLEIARVIALNSKIMILDEATSALDSTTENTILANLIKLEYALIVITHRLSSIQDCDHIIVVDKGRIVEEGKHEDLMKKTGFYHALYLGLKRE